jgi:hypothetical protein
MIATLKKFTKSFKKTFCHRLIHPRPFILGMPVRALPYTETELLDQFRTLATLVRAKLGTLPKWSQAELQPRWKFHGEGAHIEFVETSFHPFNSFHKNNFVK